MKNKKGFTLVELLAIIVILGIIALIAVPTVKRIMDDAKKKSFINSAYGIIKAGDLYYSRKDMLDEIEGSTTFTFPNNINGLEFDGKAPENGSMKISEDGDIALAISNEKYCIKKMYEDKDITITEDSDNCLLPILSQLVTTTTEITTIDECATNGKKCASGTAFAIKVNEEEIYNFHVVNDNNKEINLIMDRNLGANVKWYASNDSSYGPVTALDTLTERTLGWTNISERNYVISGLAEDGMTQIYEDITVTSRARLLTYEEATSEDIGCELNGSCPSWIIKNLYQTGDESTYGYWTSTPLSVFESAWKVYYRDGINLDNIDVDSQKYGVRPVITLIK